jgi:uncharacterized protein DUF4157
VAEAASTKTSKQDAGIPLERNLYQQGRQSDLPWPQTALLSMQHAAGNQVVSRVLQSHLSNSQSIAGVVQRHWVPCDSPEAPSYKCDEDEKEKTREDKELNGIQAKLTVSHPADRYEREADSVADLVMRTTDEELSRISTTTAAVQRKCACEAGSTPCAKCNEEEQVNRAPITAGLELVQRQAGISRKGGPEAAAMSSEVPGKLADSIRGLRGSGDAMPQSTRSFFEQRFGFDFSGVRLHATAGAGETARKLQAKAFTIGQDVIFAPGYYAPGTSEGRRLIAHELTHVVQQNRLSRLHAETDQISGQANRVFQGQLQTAPLSVVQRDKIDYKQLTWDDFKGPLPKKPKHEAVTASDFHDPLLKDLAPATFSAEDTGEECKAGKKASTNFKASVGIDPTKIEVKPYMFQEESWKKAWTTEEEARKERCKADLVKKCEAKFKAEFKKIKKELPGSVKECQTHFGEKLKGFKEDCTKFVKQCQDTFDRGEDPPFEIHFDDGGVISANSRKECSSVLPTKCTEHQMKGVDFTVESEAEVKEGEEKKEAKAATKEECKTGFAKSLEALRRAGVKVPIELAGEKTEVAKIEDCSTSFLDTCATTLMEASSKELLKHEQGHFDITNAIATKTQAAMRTLAEGFDKEVTACGEAAAIKKAKEAAKNQIKKLEARYKAGRKELSALQKQYDSDTNHGKKEEEQSAWEEKISEGFTE